MNILEKIQENPENYLNLKEINLSNLFLKEFPKELLLLTSLEVIKLDNNEISSLPNEIIKLKSLKILFLGNNKFEIYPLILGQMESLYMISFKGNNIKIIPNNSLALTLGWLILTDNQIEIIPECIGNLIYLKKLMLANNKISYLPIELSNCRQLELVRLSSNQLTQIPQWLFELPNLSWIALAGNPFYNLPSIHDIPSLEIHSSELIIGDKIGEGASGVIYHATPSSTSQLLPQSESQLQLESQLELQSSRLSLNSQYAIKYFKNNCTSDGSPMDEMSISLLLPKHSSLIPVIGTTIDPITQLNGLVFPLIPSDSYISLASPPSFETVTRDVYKVNHNLTISNTLNILYQIASCCNLLHRAGIMHGDLYGHNILIPRSDFNLSTYLVDFGAATYYYPSSCSIDRRYYESIEVNSFSKLIEELTNLTDFDQHISIKNQLQSLYNDCSQENVINRPSFDNIVNKLQELISSLSIVVI